MHPVIQGSMPWLGSTVQCDAMASGCALGNSELSNLRLHPHGFQLCMAGVEGEVQD